MASRAALCLLLLFGSSEAQRYSKRRGIEKEPTKEEKFKSLKEKEVEDDGSRLIIHAISHTHVDHGWQVPFEEYYANDLKLIFESVTKALKADEELKFNWAEVAYLKHWWEDRHVSQELKDDFKLLVEKNQIEFVSGSWVSPDEANVSSEEFLTQALYGLKFLKETFGKEPQSYWQLDPFGYSMKTPALLQELGYEDMLVTRLSSYMKEDMKKKGNLSFLWQAHH